MAKNQLKYHPAEVIQKEPSQIFEEFRCCKLCYTFLLPEYFPEQDSNLCIFCSKETKSFKNLMLFTFKNIFYFLLKFGLDSKALSKLELKQIKLMMKEDCFNYHDQNMIWYFNCDFSKNTINKKIIDLVYENFLKTEFLDKNIWNMHSEQLKAKLFSNMVNKTKLVMPKFYAASPYFENQAAKFLNRNHIFS